MKVNLSPAKMLSLDAEIFSEIKEVLEEFGLPMEHCPPMWYPEAIAKLCALTFEATEDCLTFHQHPKRKDRWACVRHAIRKLAKARSRKLKT